MASTSGAARTATVAAIGDEAAASLIADLRIDEKNYSGSESSSAAGAAGPSTRPQGQDNDDGLGDIGENIASRPTVIILIGMAGAGKTTLSNRLIATLMAEGRPPYVVNLDPACGDPPYPVNIDIRDTVDYKKVMENYSLGPNGAIVTSLNLFSTKFDQVIRLILQKPLTSQDFVVIDTPGQIEVFMWSASGQIILQSLAARFRSTVVYVTDLTNNVNPITFISNMTYGLSILYKSRLPMVVALNKCDKMVKGEGTEMVSATSFAEQWMEDFETYQEALSKYEGYASNLASSLCLSLDGFYSKIGHISVSGATGQGIVGLFGKVAEAVVEYEKIFLPEFKRELDARNKRARAAAAPKHKQELKQLAKSMTRVVGQPKKSKFDEDEEMFSVSATAATSQGFSLTMGMGYDDDDDDDTSDSEDGDAPVQSDDNEEDKESFRQFYEREVLKTKKKGSRLDK